MATGNACQSFEACIVEYLALTAKQFAGGKPRHLAERLVDCGHSRMPVACTDARTADRDCHRDGL